MLNLAVTLCILDPMPCLLYLGSTGCVRVQNTHWRCKFKKNSLVVRTVKATGGVCKSIGVQIKLILEICSYTGRSFGN